MATRFDTTRYDYDALNRMDSVVSPQGQVTAYFYDGVGNRDSVALPNGVGTKYGYDSLNRLKTLVHRNASGAVLARYAYAVNKAGIRTSVTEADGAVTRYGYDSLYRLTNEQRTGSHAYAISYTYDQVGNRLTQVRDGITVSYTYNNRDQLIREDSGSSSRNYGFDAAGRLISKSDATGTTTYSWVDEDRMASVAGPGTSVAYIYDADGRRVKETSGSTSRQYLIDAQLPYGQVIAETDGGGNLAVEYVYGQERVSQQRNGTASWYLADGQGSVRGLMDGSGIVTDSYVYTAFGEALTSTGTTQNDFRYVGEQLDPNAGFYYLRARWMNPDNGSFVSIDGFEGVLRIPATLHRYTYGANSPILYSDASGFLYDFGSQSAADAINNILITQAAPRFTVRAVMSAAARVVVVAAAASAISSDSRNMAQIRIQFQISDQYNHSGVKMAELDDGVTKYEAIQLLYNLYYTTPSWWSGRLAKWTAGAVEKMERKIQKVRYPGIGPNPGNIFREEIYLDGVNHRIDLENIFGYNLKN